MNETKLYNALFGLTREDSRLPALAGILHENGYMVASSAYSLARVHFEDYDFDYEGLVLNKDWKEVPKKYPGIKHLFDCSEMDELKEELVSNIIAACKNLPKRSNKEGDFVALNIAGFYLHTFQLTQLFSLFEVVGEIPTIFISRKSKPVILKSENCFALLMPEQRAFKAKDLLFTVAEALEFKN